MRYSFPFITILLILAPYLGLGLGSEQPVAGLLQRRHRVTVAAAAPIRVQLARLGTIGSLDLGGRQIAGTKAERGPGKFGIGCRVVGLDGVPDVPMKLMPLGTAALALFLGGSVGCLRSCLQQIGQQVHLASGQTDFGKAQIDLVGRDVGQRIGVKAALLAIA